MNFIKNRINKLKIFIHTTHTYKVILHALLSQIN
jgi:hypothetical protein